MNFLLKVSYSIRVAHQSVERNFRNDTCPIASVYGIHFYLLRPSHCIRLYR